MNNKNDQLDECARFLAGLPDLVSGQADLATAGDHGHQCESCAAEFARAMEVDAQLRMLPDVEPPADRIWQKLQPRLDELDREPADRRAPVKRLVPRLVRSPAR